MKQEELERKIQLKNETIEKQIEVLDEYRREIHRLTRELERKDQIIYNLKKLINEHNGIKTSNNEQDTMVHRTAQGN